MIPETNKRWYALYTRSNYQIKVRDYINQWYDSEAYVPCTKKKRSHAGKVEVKDVPIIPSYVFIIYNHRDFRPIREVPGVVAVVREHLHTGPYVQIPDSQIQAIMEVCRRDSTKVKFQLSELPFREGSRVRIINGIFKDVEGIVNKIDQSDIRSVYLLLNDLGYATVEVDPQDIELIE